jgi:hypothetical protein
MSLNKTLAYTLRIFLICISFSLHAQAQITKDSVAGRWICKEVIATVEGADPKLKTALETLKKGFLNSQFIFRTDGIFNLKLSSGAPAIMQDMKFLDNRKWSVDTNKNIVHIGTPQENLMEMGVKQEGSYLLFDLLEMPVILKMEQMIN